MQNKKRQCGRVIVRTQTRNRKGWCKKVSILGNFKPIKQECRHPERSIQLIVRCELKKRLVANSWGRFLHCFKIFVGVFWILIWQFVRPMIIDGWYFQRCSLITKISHLTWHLGSVSSRHLFVTSSVHDHDQDIFIDANDWVQSSSFLLEDWHYSICLNNI